jgi:hypothetical protein
MRDCIKDRIQVFCVQYKGIALRYSNCVCTQTDRQTDTHINNLTTIAGNFTFLISFFQHEFPSDAFYTYVS